MANVQDATAHMVQLFRGDKGVGSMHLQKLMYFAYGYHLSLTGKLLFPEKFEAWKSGPVCRAIFELHKDDYLTHTWPAGNAERLTEQERIVIKFVHDYYSFSGGRSMSEISKKQAPWIQARAASPDDGAAEMDPATIGAYFRALSDAPDGPTAYANRFLDKYRLADDPARDSTGLYKPHRIQEKS